MWEGFWEFTGTKLEQFPLPSSLPLARGRMLDSLAGSVEELTPQGVIGRWIQAETDTALEPLLESASSEWSATLQRMIFEQEELDWESYRLYGLLTQDMTYAGSAIDRIELAQRAFELVLARQLEAGQEVTGWFRRHRSTPTSTVPKDWPQDYQVLVKARLDLIESDPALRVLERPEFKRRWSTVTWVDQVKDALRPAILDRLEAPELWCDEQGPVARSRHRTGRRPKGRRSPARACLSAHG